MSLWASKPGENTSIHQPAAGIKTGDNLAHGQRIFRYAPPMCLHAAQDASKMPVIATACHREMNNHLVITACGPQKAGLLEEFTRTIKESGCNIKESRLSQLGEEICIVMLLAGTWDAIAKVEDMLQRLQGKLDLHINTRRTSPARPAEKMMPYAIDVVSHDHEGIVHAIVNFITRNNITIQELTTTTYKTLNSNTTMFSLHMAINIPVDISIASIRGDFMDFCDQLNLDAIMEPVK